MKEIELTQGQVAIVDDEDYEKLSIFKWCAVLDKNTNSFRAWTNDLSKSLCGVSTISMSRMVMDFPSGLIVDHINHETLDNRKENLRVCTPYENGLNRNKQLNNKVGYKGVTLKYISKKGKGKRYTATIGQNNKTINLGYYHSEIDAARAYDKKAIELFGEFANLNFPEEA